MPSADIEIDTDLVRRLLLAQHPDLADCQIVPVAHGWDNVIMRLGEDLTVRLPRRAAAAGIIEHEQRWLPLLAPSLPLPIPAPVRVGRPSDAFPWVWSIGPWFGGAPAALGPMDESDAVARSLGAFLTALHRPAPADAPHNPHRGIALAGRGERFEADLAKAAGLIDRDRVRQVFAGAAAAPPWSAPPVWLHGDLHPANILLDGGRITAVIDWGDVCGGDPASDLAVAWMMFGDRARHVLRSTRRADDACWARARGWAVALALACLANSADNPMIERIGAVTLARATSV
jgi:aminoglycoside phosphotransferase (APT) family kinase protein